MNFQSDEIIKSCKKLESGLRLAPEGIHACCMGPIISPMYWTAEEASQIKITKHLIIEKRKWLLELLNDEKSDISCKHCGLVERKRFGDVCLMRLGHINMAHFSLCNLRCSFCSFTQRNEFYRAKYDALPILREFNTEDVEWDSHVDLNGGEPTLLPDLDEYIQYFTSRGIRILLYTNAVRFHPSIYEGLADGTITWVITSLDAGTPSTFQRIKGGNKFFQVLENLSRYAQAGSQGGGMLAVKYIFCDENCHDDDLAGFAYAMLAIRPQKVWLTFDFTPLSEMYSGQGQGREHDYSKQIEAYARMFLLMKKHGLEATHFAKVHLANVLQQGEDLIEGVLAAIQKATPNQAVTDDRTILMDFRAPAPPHFPEPGKFDFLPLRVSTDRVHWEPWSLAGKRVLLAPACRLTTNLLADPAIQESRMLGFLDRDAVLHKKNINGFRIHPYRAIPELAPDAILAACAPQYKEDILGTLNQYAKAPTQICIYERQSSGLNAKGQDSIEQECPG
jgi:wyosine [tRNA(Phe)-imidazoG37] synthetase (radical SAM superfamily)